MLEFARPGFLAAGALAALLPVLVHLIARRPPERRALPTQRFLRPDPRTAIRLRRRPTDLLPLALRMALLLLLGAGLAGPAWVPPAAGTAEIVLLDRGAGAAAAWVGQLVEARRILLPADAGPRGALVLFDTAAAVVAPARLRPELFDSLAAAGAGDAPTDYAAALRALAAARAAVQPADSARATLLSPLRWEGWRAGLARLRAAAWPGAIRLVDTPRLPPAAGAAEAPPGRVAILAPAGDGIHVEAALGALGWRVSRWLPGGEPPAQADAFVLLAPPAADAVPRLLAAVRAGAAALVLPAAAPALAVRPPWNLETEPGHVPVGLPVFLEEAGIPRRPGAGDSVAAALVAAWADGTPAAVARAEGEGCVTWVSAPLDRGPITLREGYPEALDRLLRACDRPAAGDAQGALPLDAGARAVLAGTASGLPPVVPLAGSDAEGGRPLGRWLLAAALLVFAAETLVAFRRTRSS